MFGTTMKKNIWTIAPVLCALALVVPGAMAYKVETHKKMIELAFDRSRLNEDVMFQLGFERHDPASNYFISSMFYWRDVKGLLGEGVVAEDGGTRSVNHFYDARNDRGLQVGGSVFERSPDWALAESDELFTQIYAYGDAKEQLEQALTEDDILPRTLTFGRYFQTLGHVVHHVQDMAQPDHARNDAHCDLYFPCWFVGKYDPSPYEAYSKVRVDGDAVDLSGYPAVRLPRARDYWNASGKGMAEFSNFNFVTKDTNFTGTPLGPVTHPEFETPHPAQASIEKVDAAALPGAHIRQYGELWFLRVPVNDAYLNQDLGRAHRTSTYSLYSNEMESLGLGPVYSLNRYNHESAQNLLLPRAVGYSAGLLDYMLRGRIEIHAPVGGVYGVVDHATVNDTDEGFAELTVGLRNVTPDIEQPGGERAVQAMSGGTVFAIARYRTNGCYEPDLSGEIHAGNVIPSNCDFWPTYAGTPMEHVASAEITLPDGIPSDRTLELKFDFSENPIPIHARDMVLQVIYKGELGDESNAVVVAAKDMSEPTYVSYLNMTDYFFINGQFLTPQQIRDDEELGPFVDEYNIDIDPAAFTNLRVQLGGRWATSPGVLQPTQYLRLAVLADADRTFQYGVTYTVDRLGFDASNTQVPAFKNHIYRDTTGLYGFDKTRGISRFYVIVFYKYFGSSSGTIEDIAALPPLEDNGPAPLEVIF